MFTPSMVLPPDAMIGVPAMSLRLAFGDLLSLSLLALVPMALVLIVCAGIRRDHARSRAVRPVEGEIGGAVLRAGSPADAATLASVATGR